MAGVLLAEGIDAAIAYAADLFADEAAEIEMDEISSIDLESNIDEFIEELGELEEISGERGEDFYNTLALRATPTIPTSVVAETSLGTKAAIGLLAGGELYSIFKDQHGDVNIPGKIEPKTINTQNIYNSIITDHGGYNIHGLGTSPFIPYNVPKDMQNLKIRRSTDIFARHPQLGKTQSSKPFLARKDIIHIERQQNPNPAFGSTSWA